jgi:sugar lactone lactonase YvrE
MKAFISSAVLSAALWGQTTSYAGDAPAVHPNAARPFTVLPAGTRFPEGIALDRRTGDLYVGTFDFGGNNKLLRFARNGRLRAQIDFQGEPLLGLAFDDVSRELYVANFGASKIQRVPAGFADGAVVEDVANVPVVGAPADRAVINPDGSTDTIGFGNAFAAPNGLVLDGGGSLWFSDSFQGAIFRIAAPSACPGSACAVDLVAQNPLLATAGFPPFGANGIAFAADELSLFVANTGDDRVLRVNLAGTAPAVSVFAESLNGADGLAMDGNGTLWVAANQADQIVGLDANARVVAELGEFLGLRREGQVRGLLFPASLAIGGHEAFVTNLALPLTDAVGDEPEEDVLRFSVARIRLR